MISYVLTPEAVSDAEQAFYYLQSESLGEGPRFREQLYRLLYRICLFPNSARIIEDPIAWPISSATSISSSIKLR